MLQGFSKMALDDCWIWIFYRQHACPSWYLNLPVVWRGTNFTKSRITIMFAVWWITLTRVIMCGKLSSDSWTATRLWELSKEHSGLRCRSSGWSSTETVFDLYRSTRFTRCSSSSICTSLDLLLNLDFHGAVEALWCVRRASWVSGRCVADW